MVKVDIVNTIFMKKLIVLVAIIFSSCSSSDTIKNVRNDQQKDNKKIIYNTTDTLTIKRNTQKRLRYLYYANGGLVGYFDDGTIVGCPKCDLIDENISVLYTMKPIRKYIVNKDGALLVGEKEIEYPRKHNEDNINEWAMIDYKWIIQPQKQEN